MTVLGNFFYGMGTIGQLFPPVPPVQTGAGPASAWEGVSASFFQAGDNIREALKDFSESPARPAVSR
jgi:hypothetical protein